MEKHKFIRKKRTGYYAEYKYNDERHINNFVSIQGMERFLINKTTANFIIIDFNHEKNKTIQLKTLCL